MNPFVLIALGFILGAVTVRPPRPIFCVALAAAILLWAFT